uniref:Uncharacterized protein n=1 Tax=Rhizophora mucronata TaxID=61149 RepID=A0A2P2NFB0_RHIMU
MAHFRDVKRSFYLCSSSLVYGQVRVMSSVVSLGLSRGLIE